MSNKQKELPPGRLDISALPDDPKTRQKMLDIARDAMALRDMPPEKVSASDWGSSFGPVSGGGGGGGGGGHLTISGGTGGAPALDPGRLTLEPASHVLTISPGGLTQGVVLRGNVTIEGDLMVNGKVIRGGTMAMSEEKPDLGGMPGTPETRWERLANELSVDAHKAGLRLTVKQMRKLLQDVFAAAIAGNSESELRQKISKRLKTSAGSALVTSALAGVLSGVAYSTENHAMGRLAGEARTQAMTDGANIIAELIMGPLREVLRGVLSGQSGAKECLAALPSDNGRIKAPVGVDVLADALVSSGAGR